MKLTSLGYNSERADDACCFGVVIGVSITVVVVKAVSTDAW